MSKATVTRLFVGSVVAVVAGLVLGFAALIAAYANGSFVMDGPDVIGVNGSAFAWTSVALVIVGFIAVVAGAITGLVAWIGALLNTALLDDKTWFIVLLVLGLVSFEIVAMIVYVLVGPDGTRASAARQAQGISLGGTPV